MLFWIGIFVGLAGLLKVWSSAKNAKLDREIELRAVQRKLREKERAAEQGDKRAPAPKRRRSRRR